MTAERAVRRATGRARIDLQAIFQLTELADYIIPFSIRVVCDLGVADHLRDGPRSSAELAAATGAHAPSLYRVLRALACKQIFTEVEPDQFALTPLAEVLRSDHPLSLRGAYPLLPGDVEAFAVLDHAVRTGEAAFDHAHGMGYWEYMAAHPRENARLDGAQQAQTRLELRAVLRAFDWSGFRTIVDVGGGNGAFLAGVLAKLAEACGVLFDLPHVVIRASRVLAKAGVADRCEVVSGSFFEQLPARADAYVLKRILYGWNDERAVAILRAVRRAMRSDSTVIVIEPLVDPGYATDMANRYDILMLTMSGSSARSSAQLAALFAAADLRLERVVATMMFPVIVARAA